MRRRQIQSPSGLTSLSLAAPVPPAKVLARPGRYNALMITAALTLALLLPQAKPVASPSEVPDVIVTNTIEELRQAELLLDAEAMEPLLAHSFTFIEDDTRLSGAFAYLEPMRQLRDHKGEVIELRFEDLLVNVYGASAIASYRFSKSWREPGARHRESGWSTDVFEKRDDGAWILVYRHRAR